MTVALSWLNLCFLGYPFSIFARMCWTAVPFRLKSVHPHEWQRLDDAPKEVISRVIARRAEEIGATALEIELAKEVSPAPKKSNFSASGHYTGPRL